MMSQAQATAADQLFPLRQLWIAAALLPLFFSSSREEQTDGTSGQKKLKLLSRRTSSSSRFPFVKENRSPAHPCGTVALRAAGTANLLVWARLRAAFKFVLLVISPIEPGRIVRTEPRILPSAITSAKTAPGNGQMGQFEFCDS
jgi:hypothetical protein